MMRLGTTGPRRYKMLYATADLVLRCLHYGGLAWDGDGPFIATRVEFPGLLHDARFINCHYDYTRQVFALVVEHPDFPEVQQGEMIPIIAGTERIRVVHRRLVEDVPFTERKPLL